MKICVQYANGDPRWTHAILAPTVVKKWALVAESVGLDGIAFTDHPAPSGRWADAGGEGVCDPFSALGFTAAVTEAIRLFTYVLVPAYRNPFLTAQAVATLDHLSGGRLTLGLGTGYLRSEFNALGAPAQRRAAAFEETVEVMLRSWEGGDVAMTTDRFDARDTRALPRVLQRPHPPLWLHGNGDRGTEWVARHGQGWLGLVTTEQLARTTRTTPMPDLDAVARRLERLRAACERNGRSIDDLDIALGGVIPMLDVRRNADVDPGYDHDEQLRRIAACEELGVNWLFVNSCGDDPVAAIETVAEFGARIGGR